MYFPAFHPQSCATHATVIHMMSDRLLNDRKLWNWMDSCGCRHFFSADRGIDHFWEQGGRIEACVESAVVLQRVADHLQRPAIA